MRLLAAVLALLLATRSSAQVTTPSTPVTDLPARLSDEAFWKLIADFSEPGGIFRSDNFVSNETAFQYVVPRLKEMVPAGGVYLGVGPDQNFTYLVALRPKIGFIIDIRRQNLMQHLMYKATIEMAADRVEFLSVLFSRPRPPGLTSDSSAESILRAYASAPPDSALFRKQLAAIKDRLVKVHGFKLSPDDLSGLEYIYTAFYMAGPELNYSFGAGGGGVGRGVVAFGGRRMPTYAELMIETDGQGEHRSYLATEANFRVLKELETNNLVVPLVGDFAGDRAITSVGKYLKEHGATVSAFYLSNVEQYLFQGPDNWQRFYTNVGSLPINAQSTFIRAVFTNTGYWGGGGASNTPGPRSSTVLSPIAELLKAFADGKIQSYFDVVQMSK
jgi:hypothetical protein